MNGILNKMPPGVLMDPRSAMMLQTGLGLMGASGPSRMPVGLGQALGQAGMQGMNAFHQTNQANQQQQMHQLKIAEVERAAAERKRNEDAINALRKDPRFAGLGPLLDAGQIGPAIDRAIPKPTEAENPFGKVTPEKYTPESWRKFTMTKNYADLVPAAPPQSSPSAVQEYEYAKKQGFQGTFEQWQLQQKKAGAQPISIQNLAPDKKFEWEDKLRSDYKADVKAFREVEDAHRIIKNALQNPSPANDMAAATKFMKLLDPGSVVRESELSMAMQASGVLDRMANYHNLLLRGHKLTPQQREDFAAAADIIYTNVQAKWTDMDKIYDESATSYGLDPRRVKMGGGSSGNLPVRKKYNMKTGKFE